MLEVGISEDVDEDVETDFLLIWKGDDGLYSQETVYYLILVAQRKLLSPHVSWLHHQISII